MRVCVYAFWPELYITCFLILFPGSFLQMAALALAWTPLYLLFSLKTCPFFFFEMYFGVLKRGVSYKKVSFFTRVYYDGMLSCRVFGLLFVANPISARGNPVGRGGGGVL